MIRSVALRISQLLPAVALAFATLLCAQPQSHSFTLNVTATDMQGQTVTDLNVSDFQFFDNGKQKPITSAVFQTADQHSATLVVVLDLFNADLSERNLAAKSLADALEKSDGTRNVFVYLITPTGTPFAVHGVLEPPAAGLWTKQVRTLLDSAMRKVDGLKNGMQQMPQNRVTPTWNSMFRIAGEMARISGPKSLVWITQGIQDGFIVNQELHMALGPLQAFSSCLNQMRAVGYFVQSKPSEGLESESEGSAGDTLNRIAALTGGKVYRDDATGQLLSTLLNQPPSLNYQIAFSPNSLDGKYHKLRIATTRPGVKVSGPERYYAIEPPAIIASADAIPRN